MGSRSEGPAAETRSLIVDGPLGLEAKLAEVSVHYQEVDFVSIKVTGPE